jgi:hypothetical protein
MRFSLEFFFRVQMDPRDFSRKRYYSPKSERSYRDRDNYRYRAPRDGFRDHREYERESERVSSQTTQSIQPPGFPIGYQWNRGDWLCPSPGCEGAVTPSKSRNCISCGRSQPHFMILTELAKNEHFRTELCEDVGCRVRDCPRAHAACELRDYPKSRILRQIAENSTPPAPVPTSEETCALILRWKIREIGVTVLGRLPGTLSDIIHRSFFVAADVPDSETTNYLLKCLADIIRPPRVSIKNRAGFHDFLPLILKRSTSVIGLACNLDGEIAIIVDKDVYMLSSRDFSTEDMGILAFAISFNGMTVTHSENDKENLRLAIPRVFTDLLDRVRAVDNPSEIIYIAADSHEALADRANQARIDSMNPNPLLPTPTVSESP